jgi:Zn-dependent protease
MGSPFYARALFEPRALHVEGETGRYPSSETLHREFCKACGTRLFSRRTNGTAVGVALATFDDRNAFAPTAHLGLGEDRVGADRRWSAATSIRAAEGAIAGAFRPAAPGLRFAPSGLRCRTTSGAIRLNISLYDVSVWVLPLVIAITFHEAAHGFVAHRLGDNTAFALGRVSFNPLKHIDPFGTLILPGILLLSHSPFLFGYAKPVPVNFRNLNHPRLDMVWVALAGPVTNIILALTAAFAFHALPFVPADAAKWTADNLKNAFLINIVLAVFNMLPIPPLDGGRVAVGLLPRFLAYPLSRLEPYGMLILIGLLILLPIVGTQLGLNLDVISAILRTVTGYVIGALLFLTGNA